jgi:PAS domain S-box-containing protein
MTKPASFKNHPDIGLQWYEKLSEISPVGIYFTDADGNCLHVNQHWCEITGLSPEEALGRGWTDAIHPEDFERITKLWYESAEHKKPFHAEYRFCTPKGETTWVVGHAKAKLTEDGSIEGYIGTITDINNTRQSLDVLERSSGRIRTIIAHMPVILFAFDHQRLLCAWNHEAERLTGYTASDMIGNPNAMNLLCPDPDYRREMLNAYKERGDDYRNWDWELTAKDGSVKTVAFSNIAKYYPIEGWASWGVGIDMTSCRRTEQELRERVKELTCLYKLSMLSNKPNLDFDSFFQDTVELLPESLQYPEITSARIIYNERIFKTESFAVSPWKLSSDLYVRGSKVGAIEVYYSEKRPSAAEGSFLLEERLLLDEIALQVSRTMGQVLARHDLALLDELSTKAEELENFSHTISHDLKTPLTAIGGFAEFLSKQLAQGNLEQAGFCADRIVENTRRMELRLEEILRLAKIGRIIEPSEEIDLKKIIEETLDMMSKRLEEAQISVHVDNIFPKVVGDSLRLREVIENLLENAIRYIGKPPNRISIGCRREGDDSIFYVKDNGIGIDPQHLESIFELFRRHVRTIDGEGVGLAITKRIIEAHGGRIWAESEGEGSGSCFCFTLGHVISR